jgi:replicative DNA helicase
MAKELNVRVLALCQTRKGQKDDRFSEPYLGDIRGSKSLTEMVWWVLMLWQGIEPRNLHL